MSAKDDLIYLGQRLQGIIELVPVLERIENLDNWVQEKEKTLVSLEEKQKDLEFINQTIQDSIDLARVKYSQEAEDSQNTLAKQFKEFQAKVAAVEQEDYTSRQARIAQHLKIETDIQARIEQEKVTLANLKSAVAEQEQRYVNITSKLQTLKEQI